MAEQYVETIIIRQDSKPEVSTPSFADTDIESIFEFEGTLELVQILKSIQNAKHNRHDYVFKIKTISKMKIEE